MNEGREWVRMQFEACPDCGLDASTNADADLPRALTDVAARWGGTLATADIADLRRRPAPDVWSPLEYACHTRDVIAVFEERIHRTATTPGQQLGWWDHDAAVVDSRYNEQEPVLVAEAMAADYVKELREFQPEGPYLLAGNCIGGVAAFEMAQQLRAQGQNVALTALLDTECPQD